MATGRSIALAAALLGGAAVVAVATEPETHVARSTRHAAAPLLSCQSLPFRPAALRRPRGYERRDTPSARALRRFLRRNRSEFGRQHGWFRIVRRGRFIDFGAGRGPRYPHMSFELRRGRWEWAGYLECEPRWYRDGLEAATWRLDRNFAAPEAADTELHVLVNEDNCASRRDAHGRILRPLAHYGRRNVMVTFFVRPLRGVQTCPSNPPTEVTLKLAEPLGGRGLRDGGPYPTRRRD